MNIHFANMDKLGTISWEYHENLSYWPDESVFGHFMCPPAGYRARHRNNDGPVRELKDMTRKEIILLEARYGVSIKLRPQTHEYAA